MQFVALLRGINVGGKTRVEMSRLKVVCESVGLTAVRTYINSGNVVFDYDGKDADKLAALIEKAIEKEFGFPVGVLVRSKKELQETVKAIEPEWRNDKDMKCDILFLWDGLTPKVLTDQLKPKDGIDEVRSATGAVIWKVDRENATRNGLLRIMGTPAYKQVTVRNCNTTRKLLEMMEA